MGGAVREASTDAKKQLIDIASEQLEAHPSDLVVRDGGIYIVGTDRGASFSQLIRQSQSGSIVGRGTFKTKGGLDPSTGQGVASAQWHQVAGSVEVEVDVETGAITVLKLHTNTYSGRTINQTNAELQMEGSAIFGLGATLLEDMVYERGQLTNATLADYMIPSFLDVPRQLTSTLLESPDPHADPHGIGENAVGPIPAAIANAIYNAVGVRLRDLPITPEKILRNLKANESE
jgi:CO/xanthine dehydrogenase Mo-binding subunit